MGNESLPSTARPSSKPGIVAHSFIQQLDNSVISKTDMLMAEATGIMDQMELLTTQYKKLLAANAALLADKDKAESRARNAELEAMIAREKVAELETKLKAKEEEDDKVRSKLEEAANSLMNRMNKIKNTLGPFESTGIDFDSLNTSKKDVFQNRIIQLEEQLSLVSEIEQSSLLDVTGNMEDEDYMNALKKLQEFIRHNQLPEASERLIAYVLQFTSSQTTIGIKGMGALNPKSFMIECKKKLANDDWCLKSMELCLLWQEHIQNPQWRPFKNDHENGLLIIDEDDEKLKELRTEWGEIIYEAVTDALLEMEEYSPSHRTIVAELWNFKENREASLEEVIDCLIISKNRPS